MSRIGVFICHCGTNIAATVDVVSVVEQAASLPNVVYAVDNKYTCSEPGQAAIKEAIIEHKLDRIVIAACSPRMHEATFRKMLSQTELNPYMLEIANIREQCSWVHNDKAKATAKAYDLVKMAVAKVEKNKPLYETEMSINKRALVIGGGIAGVQAALDIADAGYEVDIVEREASIGGKMVMLDKTFPTMDCSACIATPKMADAGAHPNINLLTYSEVEAVSGYIGNFTVQIKKKAKYVNYDICTGCGLCETKCPSKFDNPFDRGMSKTKAISKMFAQAVPSKPVIHKEHCKMLLEGKCGVCAKLCPLGCIDFNQQDEVITQEYGAIVVATGYELIDWTGIYGEYGGGRYKDVIDGLQFERLVNASGPTEGHIQRPSDGKEPKSIAIIKCVGSRDPKKGKSYCSRACCMYGAKHAHQFLDKTENGDCYVFYMDVRTAGKEYDEFYMRTMCEDGAKYIRGRVSKIYEEDGKLICLSEDTLSGRNVQVAVDMVVVETAMVPAEGVGDVASKINISRDLNGWLNEAHPKLRPVETNTAGVFLAGTCQGPKDIPDTVAQASAAAVKVCGLFSKKSIKSDPMVCSVNPAICSGDGACVAICPYKAISLVEVEDRLPDGRRVKRNVAQVNSALCHGCGACSVACKVGAMDLAGYTNQQILEEVEALCKW